MALEGVVAAAELADIGWSRYERIAERRSACEAVGEEKAVLEALLAEERAETRRLKATMDEYEKVLKELQEKTAGVQWLSKEVGSAEGTADFFERLQQRVNAPDFLERLRAPPGDIEGDSVASRTRFSDADGYEVSLSDDDSDWWQWVSDSETHAPSVENTDLVDGSGYVVVEKEDVIDGIAHFVAKFIASHPDTKGLTPEQLQKAISMALKELRSSTVMRSLWEWGKFFYTYGSWVPTVFSMYKNPFIVRGALIGMYASSRIILGVLRK